MTGSLVLPLDDLQIAVSLFDRSAVSPSRPGFVGTSRAAAVKTGPSDARATAEGAREAVLTAVSTTSASARSGRAPQAGAAAAAPRGARPFDGRPGASRLFGGLCRATCPRC